MTFILAADGRDDDVSAAFHRYLQYLQSVKELFPKGAYALAASDWYFDASDHRCPHDARLDKIDVDEIGSGIPGQDRLISITVRLLGAYHDGYIQLRYPRVTAYSFSLADGERGHRDWRYDELRLSANGNLIHEIEWRGFRDTGRWVIEASDLEFTWGAATDNYPNV